MVDKSNFSKVHSRSESIEDMEILNEKEEPEKPTELVELPLVSIATEAFETVSVFLMFSIHLSINGFDYYVQVSSFLGSIYIIQEVLVKFKK